MRALLWKDLRVMRMVLAYAFGALVCVYAVGCLVNVYAQWRYGFPARAWPHLLFLCAICSLVLELPTAAMLGGCSFAAERADRSAEFMAYMPVSRGKVVVSKAVLTLGVLSAVWLLNLAVLWTAAPSVEPAHTDGSIDRTTWVLVSIGACMFGVAWLCSTIADSHALAASVGMCVPLLLGGAALLIGQTLGVSESALDLWFPRACAAAGVIGFLLGCRYYLHRVGP